MAKQGSNKQANIILGLNMTQLQKGLRTAQARLKRFGKSMSRFGASMSRSVTLPLVGAAVAGIKMASDLEKSFAKIENLVGVTGPVLEGFKEKLRDISTETAISQRSLADALFVITSAGIRSAEALDILTQSAKSSQVGMGETEAIARGITGAMNSYAKAGLTAARSADIMMAIVREGNLVAEDLAPTLGRVTGMAAELGISFEELGANIATFTRLGVPTEEAVTGLRGVMAAVLKPTKAAEEVLASIGMTSSDVRKKVGKEGLHKTLMFLIDALKGNEKGLSAMFGNVRALSNVLGTAGAQGESYKVILDSITNSTGMVDEAFENVSKTSAFKFDEAIVALKNNAIELGATLLPTVVKIVDSITNMANSFRDMNPVTQKTIMTIGALVAAMGPLASIIGSTSLVISSGIKLIGTAIASSNPIMIATTLLITGFLAAMAILRASFGDSTKAMSANERSIRNNHSEAKLLLKTIKSENISQDTRNRLIEKFNRNFGQYGGNLKTEEGALSNILEVQNKLNKAFSDRLKDTLIEEQKAKIFEEQLKNQKALEASDEKMIDLISQKADRTKELNELLKNKTKEDRDKAFNVGMRDILHDIESETSLQDRLTQSINKATIAIDALNKKKSEYKTPEELLEAERLAKEAADALAKEQEKIDKKAKKDLEAANTARVAKDKVDQAKLEAIEIQNEAELSLLDDFEREKVEREARYQKELATLTLAGYTDFKDFKEEFAKDMAEIDERASEKALETQKDRNDKYISAESQFYLDVIELAKDANDSWLDTMEAAGNAIESTLVEAIKGTLSTIGAYLVNGKSAFSNYKLFILGLFADMAEALGSLAIAMGVASLGIKASLMTLDPSASIGAIAAGAALLVLAGVARASMANISESHAPALASGGLAFGPTLAMVGDNRNATIDPEVIAPLSKLKAMIGDTGSQNVIVTGRLSGSDLLISNERAGRQRSRYRGF